MGDGVKKMLTRNEIKSIAMVTMTLNHFAILFLPMGLWRTILVNMGYFTAPVMCFFLVEGVAKTSSVKRYAGRLAFFAAASQLPFCLAFSPGPFVFVGMNMIFTLFCCVLLLLVRQAPWPPLGKALLGAGIVCLTAESDWAFVAPAYTLCFAWAGREKKKQAMAFFVGTALFFLLQWVSSDGHVVSALGAVVAPFVAAWMLVCWYTGKKSRQPNRDGRWGFYLYYPLHLLGLALAARLV
ncbi:MAG TPA: conjugal transfer protein TraX [Firmicutes bacterium]|nr:conjugal transfer protein TraX [Bacillota bacterium]